MRDKLADLIDDICPVYPELLYAITDHLIANGVTIQPVLTVAEKADIARICMGIEQLCINMAQPGTWEAHTRHMECGEIRELAQRYRDMELVYKVLAGHELFAPSLEDKS